MAATVFELNELPPEMVKAVKSATLSSELVIVDHNIPIAHIVLCQHPGARIPGLHPGSIQIADDFDAPLPDEFWNGEP
ncbi:MAG: hypothetical protein HY289_14890 [Planctomycetes bacterium]|nr:hypothetical protein [Planctomycetota bacterium]